MKRFFYQALHTLASKVALLVIAFASGVIIARLLGPAGRGTFALYLVLPTLVNGFGEFGIRQSAAYLIGQKEHSLRDIQSSMMALCLITTILSLLLVAGAYQLQGLLHQSVLLSALFLMMVPVGLLRRYVSALQLGYQEIEKLNYIHVIDSGMNLVLVILAVGVLGLGVAGAACALLGAHVTALAYTLWSVRSRVSLRVRWVRPLPLLMLKIGFVYGLSMLVLNLNYRVDVIMLGKMQDEASVGIYTTGVGIAELLKQVPLSIGLVLFSRSIQLKGAAVQERVGDVAKLCRINLLFAMALAIVLAVASWMLVPLVYGVEFSESTQVIWMLLPGDILLTLFITLQLFVAGQGKPGLGLYAFTPALVLNVLLNLMLIPQWNFLGAAAASAITYSFASILYVHIFSRRYNTSTLDLVVPRWSDVREVLDRMREMLRARLPRGGS